MSVTSEDVARLAGVSRATVSQVLNGHAARFAAETAQKVYDAARELDYQPSAAGRALRRGSSDFVIALIPFTTFGRQLQDLFEPMTRDLAEHGYTLVLRMATPTPEALDRLVVGMRPAAVFSLTTLTDEERAVLAHRNVLAIDPPSVSQADHDRAIGELQAATLLARGHRRLAYVHLKDLRGDPFGLGREEGFRAAAAAVGVPEIAVAGIDIDLAPAVEALRHLGPPGIALACYNDDVALTMLSAARALGFTVPEDVAVIGMDHTPLSHVSIPPLTTIEYDLAAAARYAIVGLLRSLGAGTPTVTPSPAQLHLVEGGTV